MPLLELEHVSKQRGQRVALDDVSMVIDTRELVTIFGERRSGRSTLLRVAAGIEAPDKGVVRFDATDLASRKGTVLPGISYCRTSFRRDRGPTVLEQLITGQLSRRVAQPVALACALRALERVGAAQCAMCRIAELRSEEIIRIAIARSLTADPRLLVVDEPTIGVDPLKRDDILKLLRSLADGGRLDPGEHRRRALTSWAPIVCSHSAKANCAANSFPRPGARDGPSAAIGGRQETPDSPDARA